MTTTSIRPSILDAIGDTPLVEIPNPHNRVRIVAKAEYLNAGGSIKSRTALAMIQDARESGKLQPNDTILEVSSGNEGIALAMLGAIYDHPVSIIMPDDVPPERRSLIERYGGQVIFVPAQKNIAETLKQCFAIADELSKKSHYYYARQFENPSNVRVHETTTGPELIKQAESDIDAFVAGVGTGGTLIGVARALKRRYPRVKIFAVEPATAAILSGGPVATHRQFGIGEGFIPALYEKELVDDVITVTDEQTYEVAKDLALQEGLMVGPTSGSNVYAAREVVRRLGRSEGVVATVLPDSAERYLSLF